MAAIVLTLLVWLYLVAMVHRVAARSPAYSHVRHTISELGEVGAPHQRLVALGVFLPVGVGLVLVASCARSADSACVVLAWCIAVGYLVSALFPCDRGAPALGSLRQCVHTLGAAIEYAGGSLALLSLAGSMGEPLGTAGWIVALVMFGLLFQSPIRGLIQRIAEGCLFGGLALSLWWS